MTYNGAGGETARAIAETLRLGHMDLGEVNRAVAALLSALDDLNPQVEVKIANSLWARQGIDFREDFLERNRVHLGAEVFALDFNSPSAKDAINAWVGRSTNKGKINSIVDRIDPADILFLINAIYFKGRWEEPFPERNTRERDFHLLDGSKRQHPMMSLTGEFRYFEDKTFQAVKLPYTKNRVGMYVLLPVANYSLDEFIGTLTADNWETWLSRFGRAEGPVVLPRFKLEYESTLNDVLISLGMGAAFSASQADFSAMGPTGLSIDEVRHKAVVEVNEVGTEAAAATSVRVEVAEFPRFVFIADRPFFFAIRDDETGAILFMGALYEPME